MIRKPRAAQAAAPTSFKLKTGQIALLMVAFLGIGSLAGWSVYSSTPHQVEKLAILSESNDAASLAYSQRESFNLALALEKWFRDASTIREVEIARALLGQRLQVTLANGLSTYDSMTPAYHTNLAAIDAFIRSEAKHNSISPSSRIKDFQSISQEYENFLTETRRMSKTVQQQSLKQVNKVVRARTNAEFYQSGILLIIIAALIILAWWISRDILRAFRSSRKILDEEQVKLSQAVEMLDLTRAMDTFQTSALAISLDEKTHDDFARIFTSELNGSIPGLGATVTMVDGQYVLRQGDNSALSPQLFGFTSLRFAEVMQLHLVRTRLHFEAQYRATHDLLTGFLNERGFAKRHLEYSAKANQPCSAIFIDVDRFHRINDSMGFTFGDSMLVKIANRLRELTTMDDILVKLSSDEFLVIRNCVDEEDARAQSLNLQSSLQFSAMNEGIELNVTFTIGLVLVNPGELDSTSLLHRGALALNMAQRQIRSGFAIYSPDQGQEYVESLAEEFALRQALKLNEFEMYYQPIVELSTNQVIGGEALIRWNRPGYGVVYPDEFLPIIRDLELHVELGDWVIDHSLRMLVSARLFEGELQTEGFRVGINIDHEQLKRPDFADELLNKVHKYGIEYSSVALEVTEHALIESESAFQQLQRLKGLGFVVTIDDFGTGYSNLAQVQNLPISVLKIDKSFLIPGPGREVDKQLIVDIKQLADNLKLRIVAEGVEDAESEAFLVQTGITRVQGYHYSKPLPEKDFWNWVRQYQAARS